MSLTMRTEGLSGLGQPCATVHVTSVHSDYWLYILGKYLKNYPATASQAVGRMAT